VLRFELGDPQAPRGHALLYARVSGTERIVATYCVVLPISFSIGKYLPPMFAGQIPLDALNEGVSAVSAMPIPPMFEDVESFEVVRQLAEKRADDLCDMGTLVVSDDNARLQFAAEGSAEYGELYGSYQSRWPTVAPSSHDAPLDDLDVSDVLASMLPERDRLGELAKLISQARYALELGDRHALEKVATEMRRLARPLPDKYRAEQLIEAALRPDAAGPKLAGLYLQRAYKILDEDYMSIPPIDAEIRAIGDGAPQGTADDDTLPGTSDSPPEDPDVD
jgi:hypothetical protein